MSSAPQPEFSVPSAITDSRRAGKRRRSVLVASIIIAIFVLIFISHKRRRKNGTNGGGNPPRRVSSMAGFRSDSPRFSSKIAETHSGTSDAGRALQMAQELKSSLSAMSVLGHDFVERVKVPTLNGSAWDDDSQSDGVSPVLPGGASTVDGVKTMTASLDAFSSLLGEAIASGRCDGIKMVYDNLSASDKQFRETAKKLRGIGFEINQRLNVEGTARDSDLAAAADDLIAMPKQMHAVISDIHRLGVALDLE